MKRSSVRWVHACIGAAIGLAFASSAWSAACEARSGDTRAALVELYTSEGCSSCPPADRALIRLGTDTVAAQSVRVIPIALHVDYWDSIGWKDPFAQPAFTERQAWEVRANHRRTSFTPHFFVNGRELEDWRSDLVKEIAAKPGAGPGARIDIKADAQGANALRIHVDGLIDRRVDGPLQLYVAVTENRLSSQVNAGENRGVRLDHDHVVRNWIGPISVQGSQATFDRIVDVPRLANGNIAIAAFLQDAHTAEVVQAVATGLCKPS